MDQCFSLGHCPPLAGRRPQIETCSHYQQRRLVHHVFSAVIPEIDPSSAVLDVDGGFTMFSNLALQIGDVESAVDRL